MQTKEDLRKILARIDGRGYKAYKDIEGVYDFGPFSLLIDHVQGDPFAAPTRVRAAVPQKEGGFNADLYSNKIRTVALRDLLTRKFADAIRSVAKGRRGIGGSGRVAIDAPGQEVLERTSCFVDPEKIEVRFTLGLPAEGRTILGRQAEEMFLGELPAIVERSLIYKNRSPDACFHHVGLIEDQEYIRRQLIGLRGVCFLANGSILPRRSGVEDRPPDDRGKVIPLQSPPELEVEVETLHRGKMRGMMIPEGVTLVVGGGFHGKSTLLNAVERGIYPHIPGDGRESVVSRGDCVRIRAEDGRSVQNVNIRPFIRNLPLGKDTARFSTDNASGSTSQAANILEALEMGTGVLLVDEDTSAANFMIRDRRMQELVEREKEPITPFLDRVQQLFRQHGISTILVMGGSGDYFDVADTVIMMDSYRPRDVTRRVREIVRSYPTGRKLESGDAFEMIQPRAPAAHSFNPRRGKRDVRIEGRGRDAILFGETLIELSGVSQIVDEGQTRAIGDLIHYCAKHYFSRGASLPEGVMGAMADVRRKGLDILSPYQRGDYALPRAFEVAAAINRMRTLRIP